MTWVSLHNLAPQEAERMLGRRSNMNTVWPN